MSLKKYYVTTSIYVMLIIITYFTVPDKYILRTMIAISAVFAVYDVYLMVQDYKNKRKKR